VREKKNRRLVEKIYVSALVFIQYLNHVIQGYYSIIALHIDPWE